ncbi:organic cation transporter protein-like protein, partial [Leptotrombidium deliense]
MLNYSINLDRYGRKSCFYWAPMCALVSLIITSFAPKFWVYVLFAPLLTFFSTGMYQTAFVLGMEFVGNKWRIWCGNGVQIAFSAGELILCLIAYLLQRWRKIEICIAAMAVPLLLYPWLIKESVRWQISKGQYVKALTTMEQASKWNKVDLPENLMAVNALVYYGLSLQASNIGGSSVYVSFAFLAAVEIPFIIVINILMQRFGNKIPLIAAMVIGGISCIVSAFTPNYSMYLAVIGKGCIAASFSLIYIYSVEIYPTVVRSAGIGMCIMVSRFGAIAAPYISDMKFFGESGPIIMCGLFSFISGILVIDLPETHKRNLPEQISDIKHFPRFN